MATTFKTLTANDITNTRTLLHEAIPITGTIVSGTYADQNIKTYSHGMFESVYDYPYLSSSANHIFDITVGMSNASALSQSIVDGDSSTQFNKKKNVYNQMAAVLMGHDADGAIQKFDQDGDLAAGGTKINDAIFFNFARLLGKDEIKKASFLMSFTTGGTPVPPVGDADTTVTIGDYGAQTSYLVNSPAGEYAVLYTSSAATTANSGVGLLFYQAGVAVLTGALFKGAAANQGGGPGLPLVDRPPIVALGEGIVEVGTTDPGMGTSFVTMMTGSTIEKLANSLRNRLTSLSFNNTVELNSTIYFCRASHNEFNYSANPTYLDSSKIRVKNTTSDNPVTYITTVGLYSSDNELLAVAKLSEPLKKDPNTELTLRVRLDY